MPIVKRMIVFFVFFGLMGLPSPAQCPASPVKTKNPGSVSGTGVLGLRVVNYLNAIT